MHAAMPFFGNTTGNEMNYNDETWKVDRKGRVTEYDAGAFLGLDPNNKPHEAMRRMVREWQGLPSEFEGNIATQWGVIHELEAMEVFERELKVEVTLGGFISHPVHFWLGAKPQGYAGKAIVKIKCPFGIRKDKEPKFKSIDDQPHYYAQLQIQMFCSGAKMAYFYQWTPHGSSMEVVPINNSWIEESLPKLKEFYDKFLSVCEEEVGELRPVIDTPRALQMVAEYNDLEDAIAQAQERKTEILENIVEMCGGRNAVFGGKNLTKVEKSGAVSYAKAIKELAPNADLEKWRGKPSSYWMLK
jgi:putative phage-type endonuclease